MTANRQHSDIVSMPDEDIPDLSASYWAKKFEAAPVKRGRPMVDNPKISTPIRLDSDVIAYFKKGGRGWQSRINTVLREIAGLK